MIVTIALGIVAVISFLYAVTFYLHLRRWSRLMNNGRIAISYKRKVVLQGPIREWALWCKMLDDDKDSSGRVLYRGGSVAVAITKAYPKASWWRLLIARIQRKRHPRPPQTGAWSATDQTKLKAVK